MRRKRLQFCMLILWPVIAVGVVSLGPFRDWLGQHGYELPPNSTYLDLGNSWDGRGTLVKILSNLVASGAVPSNAGGYDLILVGDCGHCTRFRVETLPTLDDAGRPFIVVTGDKSAFKTIRDHLRKSVLYDSKHELQKALNMSVAPRRYCVDFRFRVIAAETGERILDGKNGF
jgi:hypothetical protein